MRQIEFRGKRIDNGEWVYGSYHYSTNKKHHYILALEKFNERENVNQVKGLDEMCLFKTEVSEIDPSTVGQFTGLTDKNGKKIFEGDVLSGIIKEQQDNDGKNAYQITDKVSFRLGGFNVFGKEFQSAYTARVNNATSLHQFMWYDRGHFNVPDLYFQIDNIEIIGNIHDNPELLNQQQ